MVSVSGRARRGLSSDGYLTCLGMQRETCYIEY